MNMHINTLQHERWRNLGICQLLNQVVGLEVFNALQCHFSNWGKLNHLVILTTMVDNTVVQEIFLKRRHAWGIIISHKVCMQFGWEMAAFIHSIDLERNWLNATTTRTRRTGTGGI